MDFIPQPTSAKATADMSANANPQSKRSRPQLLSTVLWLVLILGTLYVLAVGKSFFIPVVVALIAVYLIHALSRAIQKPSIRGHRLPGAVALALSFLVIFVMGYALFAIVAENAFSVANEAPKYQARLIQLQHEWFERFGIEGRGTVQGFLQSLNLRSLFTMVASGVASLLGNVTLVLLYSLFLLLELRFLPRKLKALLPDVTRRQRVEELVKRIDRDIQTYLGIKAVVSLITGLLSYIVMRAVGLDFAEFWALLVIVLNFIPTIGSIVATALPALLAAVQFESIGPVLIVFIGIMAIQQLMGNIIEPNILGQSLNLSPLGVIMFLILAGSLWGIVGMFLCVPMMVILVIILSNFESARWVAILLSKTGQEKARRQTAKRTNCEEGKRRE